MNNGIAAPDQHVKGIFQVPSATPTQLGEEWAYGWRCDRAVLGPAAEPAQAAWIGRIMQHIRPRGVAVSRPIPSSDGRTSVLGWRARTFLSGSPAPRFDEMAAAILRFNEALRDLSEDLTEDGGASFARRPEFFQLPAFGEDWAEADVFAAADAAAVAEDPTPWIEAVLDGQSVPREDIAAALVKIGDLLELRTPLEAEVDLVHGDPLSCIIFDDAADPIITDFVPAWHPIGWSVALLIVDGCAWGNAPDALIDRWSHLADFDQLLLHACLYRLFVHVLHPLAQPAAWDGLSRIADVVAARVARAKDAEADGAGETATEADN